MVTEALKVLLVVVFDQVMIEDVIIKIIWTFSLTIKII